MSTPPNDQPKESTRPLTPAEKQLVEAVRQSIGYHSSSFKLLSNATLSHHDFASLMTDNLRQLIAMQTKPYIDMSKSLTANLPKFKLDLPTLSVDYARLFGPALNTQNLWLHNTIDAQSIKAFSKIYEQQRKQFAQLFDTSALRRMMDTFLPPNWHDVNSGGLANLELLLLDEGLALGWVPESKLLQKLFSASSKRERRRLIGRQWKSITSSCRDNIITITDTDLSGYRGFALKAIDALESGYPEAAQALAANLLDTMLRDTLDDASRRQVTGQRQRLVLNNLSLKAAIVFGGIWGSFTEFWPSNGDLVPQAYSRHASAHAVGRRQYSRINAVLAVMHVTAYLKLLESNELRSFP